MSSFSKNIIHNLSSKSYPQTRRHNFTNQVLRTHKSVETFFCSIFSGDESLQQKTNTTPLLFLCAHVLGQRVLKHCTDSPTNGECVFCEEGKTYREEPNSQTTCELCDSCSHPNGINPVSYCCVIHLRETSLELYLFSQFGSGGTLYHFKKCQLWMSEGLLLRQ